MNNSLRKVGQEESRKQMVQSRAWLLGLSADHFDRDYVVKALSNYRYVGQMEIGKLNGYKHWQIFIDNPSSGSPIKFDTLRRAFPSTVGASVDIAPYDKAKSTKQQCYNYCTKTDTAVIGTRIMRGDWSSYEHEKQNKKANNRDECLAGLVFRVCEGEESVASVCRELTLEDSRKYRDELTKRQLDYVALTKQTETRELTVNYLVGKSRIGKTTFLRNLLGNDVYRVSNYSREPWDQYLGQKKVILDEFRGQIDFSEMLNILDVHPVILGARYNNKYLLADEIWVVSNRKIEDQYPTLKRDFPEDWEAFYARFHKVYRMNARNEDFELLAQPALDQLAAIKLKNSQSYPKQIGSMSNSCRDEPIDIDNLPFWDV